MQENRSFDHYFGTMSGFEASANRRRRGNSTAGHPAWGPPATVTMPFRLDTTRGRRSTVSASTTPTIRGRGCTMRGTAAATTAGCRCRSVRSVRRTPRADGLLRAGRHPRPPGARRRVHRVRQPPLLGAGPDQPQPAVLDQCAPRSVGSPRRPEPAHPDDPAPPRLFVAHDAGEPHRGGRLVEGVQQPRRRTDLHGAARRDDRLLQSSRRIRTRSSPGAAWRRPIRRIWPPMCAPVGCRGVCRGDPATGAMRTPGTARCIRRCRPDRPAPHLDVESGGLGTHSPHRQLRRERRLLRPRRAADPPPGTPGEYVDAPHLSKVKEAKGIRGPIGLGYRFRGW